MHNEVGQKTTFSYYILEKKYEVEDKFEASRDEI
jgi:hypothetical protein